MAQGQVHSTPRLTAVQQCAWGHAKKLEAFDGPSLRCPAGCETVLPIHLILIHTYQAIEMAPGCSEKCGAATR